MERCPPEVVHVIYSLLKFDDISSFRCTAKKFADIGLEHLTNTISAFLTENSITRAKALANHVVIRNRINSLKLEGYILANVGCEHAFASHFDSDHHRHEKPQDPGPLCSSRARRLYERNLAKFERDIKRKYEDHRNAWEAQQKLIKSPTYSSIGRSVAQHLPKLERITLLTLGRCVHTISERFSQEFSQSCASPMDADTEHSIPQLQHLLAPGGTPLQGLKELDVYVLSPSFFSSTQQSTLNVAFSNLRRISLTFRLSIVERPLSDTELASCYGNILGASLADSLAAARGLEYLLINFEDDAGAAAIDLKTILGDYTWPKLKRLDLDYISADEEYFTAALERHSSSLKHLLLGFVTLQNGTWISMVKSLRKLDLDTFSSGGVFEDEQDFYVLDLVDIAEYVEHRSEVTMAEHLEWYITAPFSSFHDFNPLTTIDYGDLEDLKAEFGSEFSDMHDFDEDSGMSSPNPDLSTLDDDPSDEDMPDLEEIID